MVDTAELLDHSIDFLDDLLDAYEQFEMPTGRYVGLVVVPGVVLSAVIVGVSVFLPVPAIVKTPIVLLGFLVVGAAVLYPKLYLNQRRTAIENQLHLVMTHMTVLSTTNIDRMEVFRRLAAEDEYGVLAEEMGRVVDLVDTWNQSLDDACRRRAKVVPSKPLSNFLDRLGYTLGAGQSIEDFLLNEQSAVIQEYKTVYQGSLNNMTVMKDLYMSMILSMTFALVFAVVLPILSGTDPTTTVSAVIVMFMFVQVGFYLAIRSVAPYDPLWYYPEDDSAPSRPRLIASFVVGGGLSFVLVALAASDMLGFGPVGLNDVVFIVDPLPLPLYFAVPTTPLVIPGLVIRVEEMGIQSRDEEFPSFIRALGATESAKQSTTTKVLSSLREKDFGPLTDDIDRLYRRLNLRLDTGHAWRLFAIDSRSYLIQKFSEMYVAGRQMGGDPQQLGELISENMNEVNQLREQRRQETITLIGLLYGITAASSFAFFIGLQVVSILTDLTEDFSTGDLDFGQLIYAGVYDIQLIQFLLLLVILFNAVLSSIMIRTVDGGNKSNALIHFVALLWLGTLTAVVTKTLVTAILTI
jgi:flagellar protein FlaJ